MKKQHEINKALEMMKKRQEWHAQQPTMAERRKQKGLYGKVSRFIDKTADLLENFTLEDALEKSETLKKIDQFFFPENWEEVEVPVEEEPEVGSYTTKDNVIHVQFGKKQDK